MEKAAAISGIKPAVTYEAMPSANAPTAISQTVAGSAAVAGAAAREEEESDMGQLSGRKQAFWNAI